MSNTIANRAVICEVLMEHAKKDRDLIVMCSDSRGSASLAPFADAFPKQFVEVGIAEQSLVSTAAGLARCGKKVYVASPASFLSTRSIEQVKVDVAYSHTNVKLIGISGGVSYGALGMTHHSAQDIAQVASIPGMRVYLPSDRHQTRCLFEELLKDEEPAYIRVGRNPVEDIYPCDDLPDFGRDRATVLKEGSDVTLIATGELVYDACAAASELEKQGVSCAVIDVHCIKPLDEETILRVASGTKCVYTVEEHVPFGGLGSMVSQLLGAKHPMPVCNLSLPDAPVITGTSREVFAYYRLDCAGIVKKVLEK